MIKEAVQEVSKSTLTVILVLGVALLIIAASDGITVSTFSLRIPNTNLRIIVGIIGLSLICLGIYLVWRESLQPKGPKSLSKTAAISHILRSTAGNPDHRAHLTFANSSSRTLDIFWIDYEGTEKRRGQIAPGGRLHKEYTFSTHPFLIKDSSSDEQLLITIPRNQTELAVTISIEDPDEE